MARKKAAVKDGSEPAAATEAVAEPVISTVGLEALAKRARLSGHELAAHLRQERREKRLAELGY